MPTLDLRPVCRDESCRSRAVKRGYCKAHQKIISLENRDYDENFRNKDKEKVYKSQRWRNKRLSILRQQPLCTKCLAAGDMVLAQMVDHLLGFTDWNDPRAWDSDLLYPLCNKCHAVVTAHERRFDFSSVPLETAVFMKYQSKMRKDEEMAI